MSYLVMDVDKVSYFVYLFNSFVYLCIIINYKQLINNNSYACNLTVRLKALVNKCVLSYIIRFSFDLDQILFELIYHYRPLISLKQESTQVALQTALTLLSGCIHRSK